MPTNTHSNSLARRFTSTVLARLPRPDTSATEAIRQWALAQGHALDPAQVDAVTLHYQFWKGQWYGQVVDRMPLPEAVIRNWQGESDNNLLGALFHSPWGGHPPTEPLTIVDRLPHAHDPLSLESTGSYQVFNGLYRRVPGGAYGPAQRVGVSAEAFQAFIQALDFHTPYTRALKAFWAEHLNDYAMAAKGSFIAACNKQVAEGSLGAAGQQLAWRAAGLAGADQPPPQAIALNIYGYLATDILCIRDAGEKRLLLYVPGNASPLHEFPDAASMKAWVAQQCRNAGTRQALQQHFPLFSVPDGLSYSGLETALQGLGVFPEAHHFPTDHSGFATSGFWDPQTYVNYKRSEYSPLLTGDLFINLAQRQRARSLADADWEITTDAQVRKARWAGYLNDALNALGPLTLLVPEASLLLAAGGIAELGLGIDRLVHAHNLAEEAQSLGQASFGLLNATPLAEAALDAGANVFTFKSSEFTWPETINGQWGYPLSPVDPPHLPPLRAHDFFSPTDTLAPLAEADTGVSQAVVRIAQPRGAPDELHSLIGSDVTRLRYDLEFNAFVAELDLNEINHPWYVSAGPGSHALVAQASEPAATDAQRLATLRALGNDLALPVDYPALLPSQATPIPKQVWGIWVGEHLIGDNLLDTIAANATTLKKIGYRNRLLLTRANPQRYQQNVEALALKAPGLEVLPLEEQPFYEAFRQGPMFEHYQAAIDGNGGVATNYASACDVLRYPLLHSEGGIYKDLDDLWFDSPEFPEGPTLNASADGLILHLPVSNELLGMRNQYNTSIIGSHAGNPTLEAVSQEMQARWAQTRDFYDSRPSREADPEAFSEYAARLNRLTGPGVFNDVIDQRLPALYQLRQYFNLIAMLPLNVRGVLDIDRISDAMAQHMTFMFFTEPGALHSWTHT